MIPVIVILCIIIVVSLVNFKSKDRVRINKLNSLLSLNYNQENKYLKLKELLKEK